MPSNGGSADSAGGDRGDGGDSSGGNTGGGGDHGGGLGGSDSRGWGGSGGMNPDARDDPSRKGIDGMGQGLSGTSGGLSNRSFGDSLSLGFAQLSADPMGYASHVARENGWGLAGGLAGFALGGVPGAFAGQKIGSIADDFGNLTNADIASRALGGLSAFGTPAAKMASAIASTAIDPDTKFSSHIAGVVGAGLGGKHLGGKYGAMAAASLAQGIGNLAPAGEMNPQNSDLSSAGNTTIGGDVSPGNQSSNDSNNSLVATGGNQGNLATQISANQIKQNSIKRQNYIDWQNRNIA